MFAKLADPLSRENEPAIDLRSYLFETAYQLIRKEARFSDHRTSVAPVDLLPHEETSTVEEGENRERFERELHVIQNDLTNHQRHVIFLRYTEGFSLLETTTILRESTAIIKAAQNRALGNLRKVLMPKPSKLQ